MPQKCVFLYLCCCHTKRRIDGWDPPILLLLRHRLCNIICGGSRLQIYSQCHTKRRIHVALPTNDKDLKRRFLQHSAQLLTALFFHHTWVSLRRVNLNVKKINKLYLDSYPNKNLLCFDSIKDYHVILDIFRN